MEDFAVEKLIAHVKIYGGFLKWWYQTTMGFPTKNDPFGVFWGYGHFRKPHITEKKNMTQKYAALTLSIKKSEEFAPSHLLGEQRESERTTIPAPCWIAVITIYEIGIPIKHQKTKHGDSLDYTYCFQQESIKCRVLHVFQYAISLKVPGVSPLIKKSSTNQRLILLDLLYKPCSMLGKRSNIFGPKWWVFKMVMNPLVKSP